MLTSDFVYVNGSIAAAAASQGKVVGAVSGAEQEWLPRVRSGAGRKKLQEIGARMLEMKRCAGRRTCIVLRRTGRRSERYPGPARLVPRDAAQLPRARARSTYRRRSYGATATVLTRRRQSSAGGTCAARTGSRWSTTCSIGCQKRRRSAWPPAWCGIRRVNDRPDIRRQPATPARTLWPKMFCVAARTRSVMACGYPPAATHDRRRRRDHMTIEPLQWTVDVERLARFWLAALG
jgi:hypothetical protein